MNDELKDDLKKALFAAVIAGTGYIATETIKRLYNKVWYKALPDNKPVKSNDSNKTTEGINKNSIVKEWCKDIIDVFEKTGGLNSDAMYRYNEILSFIKNKNFNTIDPYMNHYIILYHAVFTHNTDVIKHYKNILK